MENRQRETDAVLKEVSADIDEIEETFGVEVLSVEPYESADATEEGGTPVVELGICAA